MMSQVPASAELPTLGEIGALGAASAELWSAVADLLNLLDRELGSDGSGLMKAQISAAAARAVLEEGSAARPPCGWQSCLAAGYAKMNDCASALDARSSGSVPMIKLSVEPLESLLLKPKEASWACWQELLHLWTKTAYLGGTHWSGGLAARLLTRPLFSDRRAGPRTTPPYYRWDRHDIEELRKLAHSAGLIATSIVGGVSRRSPKQ